jgi:hypothetical protein
MTVIEIRPFRNGWSVFEAPGVEPVFLEKKDAIDYATDRACFRPGEIRIPRDEQSGLQMLTATTEKRFIRTFQVGPRESLPNGSLQF